MYLKGQILGRNAFCATHFVSISAEREKGAQCIVITNYAAFVPLSDWQSTFSILLGMTQ